MTLYKYEREVFDKLRRNCSEECRREYEQAVETLVFRYNTSVYENRFVVGGALEVFTLGLLRTAGVRCELVSEQATGGDILLDNDAMFSVKSSLVGISDIRLINQMGKGERHWSTATLFVVSQVGIVFGTPEMIPASEIKAAGDALVLKKKGLNSLISNNKNVIPLNIPIKPSSKLISSSMKASSAVARQILYDTNSQTLLTAVARYVN